MVRLTLLRADGEAYERSPRDIAARWPPSGRGVDTRRRAAPLSNPLPAQLPSPAIRPFARNN
eukprot:5019974-Prymnesium_polylepis.1